MARKRNLFVDYLLLVLAFVLINLVVFYTGLYGYICKPDSYAGNVYTRFANLQNQEKASDQRVVALIGDSTTEEGISEKLLRDKLRRPVANLALPGTSPLEWLHYLRAVDPDRKRFEKIVITITPQNMRGTAHDEGFQSLTPVAGPANLFEYVPHFPRNVNRLSYYYAAVDRIFAFRRDIKDLMLSPSRLFHATRARQEFLAKLRDWKGYSTDVCDVQVRNGKVRGGLEDRDLRKLANNALDRTDKLNDRPQVTGILEPMQKIVDYYRGSDAQILVVSIPFGLHHNISRDAPAIRKYFRTLTDWAALSHVDHWDATSLAIFRDCRSYYEFRHLNAYGRTTFTSALAIKLQPVSETAQK